MKDLGTVTPGIFEDELIIALSLEWAIKFKQIPTFRVIIDNKNRLCLIGPEICKKE